MNGLMELLPVFDIMYAHIVYMCILGFFKCSRGAALRREAPRARVRFDHNSLTV